MHAYHELHALAAANRVRFLFEAAVTLAVAIAAIAHLPRMQVPGSVQRRCKCHPIPDGGRPLDGLIHGLTLSEIHPDAVTTAYGPLADFITIARG